jgi:hypothetical protein
MTTALIENPANADFNTGLSVPVNGEAFLAACDAVVAAFQEGADRAQALAKLLGLTMSGGIATRKILVPLAKELRNSSSVFTYVASSGAHYWQQSSVGVGGLQFDVPQLPIGAKITGAYAWWANASNTTLPVTTMPALALEKNIYSVGAGADPGGYNSTVASQADTTAVVGTYQLMHKIAITGLSEVVAEDVVYRVLFTGENSTNATTGGNLAAIFLTLSV